MRLKEWLIAQIDSGRYPGLRWENRQRTLFRIPWKHAAKQDYRQQQDAALFKVPTAPRDPSCPRSSPATPHPDPCAPPELPPSSMRTLGAAHYSAPCAPLRTPT